jgi:hypothetical protein
MGFIKMLLSTITAVALTFSFGASAKKVKVTNEQKTAIKACKEEHKDDKKAMKACKKAVIKDEAAPAAEETPAPEAPDAEENPATEAAE